MAKPSVRLNAWMLDGTQLDVTFELPDHGGQPDTVEGYIAIHPPEGLPFAVRMNELLDTIQLVQNAGDAIKGT